MPTILISSVNEKLGRTRSYRTVSALKVDIPVVPKVFWRIDLISSVVYFIIDLIDTLSVEVLSLNIICSPAIKDPVVCDRVNSFVPVELAW